MPDADRDTVVIGSGPNGLVAAALLARAGWSDTVLERAAKTLLEPMEVVTAGRLPSRPRAGTWSDISPRFLERVRDRLEEHSPGLREQIVGVAVRTPVTLESENPNLVGGDLGGGSNARDRNCARRVLVDARIGRLRR